jgi:hypothetical protein
MDTKTGDVDLGKSHLQFLIKLKHEPPVTASCPGTIDYSTVQDLDSDPFSLDLLLV